MTRFTLLDRAASWRPTLLAIAASLFVWATPASAQDGCSDALTPGDYSCMMEWAGRTRSYLVHVPASYAGDTAVPLLMDLHGYLGSAKKQQGKSGQLAQSDRRGFIAVWPEALNKGWNGYGCCGDSAKQDIDDVGYLRALVARLQAQGRIDRARTFVTGHSNGGSMTQRMACEASDVFRAAAPVSFPLNTTTDCRPVRPITVVEFHGTADEIVSYYGVGLFGFQGARKSLATWAALDGCSGDPVRTQLKGLSRDETFVDCRGGTRVGLVSIAFAFHEVYGNADVDIADYIWTHVFDAAP